MNPDANNTGPIPVLKQMLDAVAEESTRTWWERYLRGAISFRGVGIPKIRDVLFEWRDKTGVTEMSRTQQLEIALALFESDFAEDKLAGILYLQIYLADRFPWVELVSRVADIYQRNLIFDWNTGDWLCVRVLGPTLVRAGKPMATVLCEWSKVSNLWQARAGAVTFIRVADDPQFYLDVNCVLTRLISREERFAKTAVGWVLREISKHDEDFVISFLNDHLKDFSVEAIKNASKYFEKEHRLAFAAQVRSHQNTR